MVPILEIGIATSLALNLAIALKWTETRQQIQKFVQCPTYGCLTRQGIDHNWQRIANKRSAYSIVFFDVDGMKQANERWGYQGVNRRIAAVISQVRSDELIIGRWFSGDEIIILTPREEEQQTANRIQQAFVEQELSATFAIAPCCSESLEANVKPASDLVQQAKAAGRRGTINFD